MQHVNRFSDGCYYFRMSEEKWDMYIGKKL